MSKTLKDLESWFKQRPIWLQDAARRMIQGYDIDEASIKELLVFCKAGAGIFPADGSIPEAHVIPDGSIQYGEMPTGFRLQSISAVKGINALFPRKPLEFGNNPLVVVYGQNGSGKSGYVRALKHACGAKQLGALHGNVFSGDELPPQCDFTIIDGDKAKTINWKVSDGIHETLENIDIFDSSCADVYITKENELSYEPRSLRLMSELIEISTQVSTKLQDEINDIASAKRAIPGEYSETEVGKWYANVDYRTTEQELNEKCKWDTEKEKRLGIVRQRLAEPDPMEKVTKLKANITNTEKLRGILEEIHNSLTDEACVKYIEIKKDAIGKRKLADEDIKSIFSDMPLQGVGSDTWKLLWQHARKYSEEYAYVGVDFPNIQDGARCVLCLQSLDAKARERFGSFESYITGKLESAAINAEANVLKHQEEFFDIPSEDEILLLLDAAGIGDSSLKDNAISFRLRIHERKEALLKQLDIAILPAIPESNVIKTLENESKKTSQIAASYSEDIKKKESDALSKELNQLEVQKWISQQKDTLENELKQLRHLEQLSQAKKLLNTKALSDKKSSLAEEMITSAFINRFREEMKLLGGGYLQAEIEKSRTEKGHVYHQVKLAKCKGGICPSEILSEGEFRLVSMAAFLADIGGRTSKTPVIFDDPVSLLDERFEENAIKRLVELCKTRQIIIFTHRISLLVLMEDAANKAQVTPELACLRRETWGAGEPSDIPINAKRSDRGLTSIRDHRIAKAKNILNNDGKEEYDSLAKGICSDIRILLERLVETVLIADVVQRFRRAVHTQNKIEKLAKINSSDCTIFEDLMAKYSAYEHSQPSELPGELPGPDDILNDIESILTWLKEFSKREIPA